MLDGTAMTDAKFGFFLFIGFFAAALALGLVMGVFKK